MLANDIPLRASEGVPTDVVTVLSLASAPSILGSDRLLEIGEDLELRWMILCQPRTVSRELVQEN